MSNRKILADAIRDTMATDLHTANNHAAIVCKCPRLRSRNDHTHTKRCPMNAEEIYTCETCQAMPDSDLDVVVKAIQKAHRSTIDHSGHDHPATRAARAVCRKSGLLAAMTMTAPVKKAARPKPQPPIKAARPRTLKLAV